MFVWKNISFIMFHSSTMHIIMSKGNTSNFGQEAVEVLSLVHPKAWEGAVCLFAIFLASMMSMPTYYETRGVQGQNFNISREDHW